MLEAAALAGIAFLGALVFGIIEGPERAINYTTVYLIERSLSLDNLFVFLLLFTYFSTPVELRARLLFWGIVFALAGLSSAAVGLSVAALTIAQPRKPCSAYQPRSASKTARTRSTGSSGGTRHAGSSVVHPMPNDGRVRQCVAPGCSAAR